MVPTVTRLRNGAGVEFFVANEPDRYGNYKQYTAQEVVAGQFNVKESATAESILRESDGWVKVPRRSRFVEDDSQEFMATQHSLRTRGFDGTVINNEATFRRGNITVIANADGSWKCGKTTGKNCKELNTFLDTNYPQESAQQDRLRAAFEHFLPPAEAALAARGPMQNGTEIDVQLRGNALMNRLGIDLMEPQR